MASREVVPIILSRAAGSALDTDDVTSFDSSDDLYINFFDPAWNAQQGRLIILIGGDSDSYGKGSACYMKFKTSTNNPFTGSGMDDLSIQLSTEDVDLGSTAGHNGKMTVIGPLETARFLDTDGEINFEWSTASTDTGAAMWALAIVIP